MLTERRKIVKDYDALPQEEEQQSSSFWGLGSFLGFGNTVTQAPQQTTRDIVLSPRLWEAGAETLPPSSEVPKLPITEGRSRQDKAWLALFTLTVVFLFIQGLSATLSANYQLPFEFDQCERRLKQQLLPGGRNAQIVSKAPKTENEAKHHPFNFFSSSAHLHHVRHKLTSHSRSLLAFESDSIRRLEMKASIDGLFKGPILEDNETIADLLEPPQILNGSQVTQNQTVDDDRFLKRLAEPLNRVGVNETRTDLNALITRLWEVSIQSWNIMLLLAIGSILTGMAWVYLLGDFTFPVMVTTLALLPLFLFALGVWSFFAAMGGVVYTTLFVLWTLSLVVLVNITEKLKLSAALIGCASKILRGHVSVILVGILISLVQLVWLTTCCVLIGVSFMSGEAVPVFPAAAATTTTAVHPHATAATSSSLAALSSRLPIFSTAGPMVAGAAGHSEAAGAAVSAGLGSGDGSVMLRSSWGPRQTGATVAVRRTESGPHCEWQTDGWAFAGMLFIAWVMLWGNAVLNEVKRYTVCGALALLYFDERPWDMAETTKYTWAAVKHGFTTSFGTICLSSLVLTPATVLKFLLRDVTEEQSGGGFIRRTGSCGGEASRFESGGLCGWRRAVWRSLQLESTVGLVDRFAVPLASMFGFPFCHSAKMATLLMRRHDLELVASDYSNAVVVRVGAAMFSLAAALASSALCGSYVAWVYRGTGSGAGGGVGDAAEEAREALVRTVATRLVFCAAWVISNLLLSFFAGMLLDAVDAMLLLYAVDRDHMRVTPNGEELHHLLSGMQVGRPLMSMRYTPRGWTYQGRPEMSEVLEADELVAAEEAERRQNLSKYEIARASSVGAEWGMQRALDTLEDHENRRRWHEEAPTDECMVAAKLAPFAILFMCLVVGASWVHFDDSRLIPGQIYGVSRAFPVLFPLAASSHMVEVKMEIPAAPAPDNVTVAFFGVGFGDGGLPPPPSPRISAWLFEMADHDWRQRAGLAASAAAAAGGSGWALGGGGGGMMGEDAGVSLAALASLSSAPPVRLGQWRLSDRGEVPVLLEFDLDSDPSKQVFVVSTDSDRPLAVAVLLQSLGWSGPYQSALAAAVLVFTFGMITTEVLHRTMVAMIGVALTLVLLALQHRVPSLSKAVGWMDHGTLALLWGMMVIVGITMRTGFFEWTGVLACRLSGGHKARLALLLFLVTGGLSAFLDNVTTILLIAPVTIKLCKLVGLSPVPLLVGEAIFSNLGGTATMIGDPPNILIGNMLSDYLTFNDFLLNLAPGVLLACPAVFWYLMWYYGDYFEGKLDVDVEKLTKMYPITDRALLIKCGTVLGCVMVSFFLNPVTHLDPAWVAIAGAVWLLVAFDMHHCHEALQSVEWDTLLFIAALFVMIEGLGELGLWRLIAQTLSELVAMAPVGWRQYLAIGLIMWGSAVLSAFVDNVPFTATMVPIMLQMVHSVEGISIEPLAWALAFGACFGGNGTLIGASANIVMAGKAESEGHHISFVDFMKVGFPAMIISVAIANLFLFSLNAAYYQAATTAHPMQLQNLDLYG